MNPFPLNDTRSHRRNRGISLIELLAVVAILGILLALAAPPFSALLRSSDVANAGDQLLSALSQARQTAVSRNRTVELRIYRYVDSSLPQEPPAGRFRSVQLFAVGRIPPENAPEPLGRVIKLPPSTSISESASLSSILDPASRPLASGASLGHPIAPCGLDYQAAVIRFFPDGSTDLPGASPVFLTVVPATAGENHSGPPENFATVVIQTGTGKARLHRP